LCSCSSCRAPRSGERSLTTIEASESRARATRLKVQNLMLLAARVLLCRRKLLATSEVLPWDPATVSIVVGSSAARQTKQSFLPARNTAATIAFRHRYTPAPRYP
jgi:hypothetical protein